MRRVLLRGLLGLAIACNATWGVAADTATTVTVPLLPAIIAICGLIAFFSGMVFWALKQAGVQFNARLDERFEKQDKDRDAGQERWRKTFEDHTLEERRERAADRHTLENLKSQITDIRIELPARYVRREDYVRGQSVIEAKLDATYNKMDTLRLRGNSDG